MPGDLLPRRTDGGHKMSDPIVEEVRKYRMVHTRKFQGNLAAICEDLRAVEAASGHEIVRLPSQKIDSKLKPHRLQKS
jgi:hypothetical protein